MNFKLIIILIFSFFLLHSLTATHAQYKHVDWEAYDDEDSTHKPDPDSIRLARDHANDSLREARAHASDSTREVREHRSDSARIARQAKTDSITAVREKHADSLAAIRAYKNSKKYTDSVSRARNKKVVQMRKAREAHLDSMKEARQHVTDSLLAVRKYKTDSIKAFQKKRSDSLAKIKRYKSSRRYADSVSLARRAHSDSLLARRQAHQDSMTTVRKHTMDSTTAARKRVTDSIKTVRTHFMDSVKVVRKAHSDSLAKVRKMKEEMAKAKEKKKQEEQKLKLEIKLKQKHEKWSNTSMLKKRWSPVRRLTQNSFTHYNYYYNAKKRMEEAETNMQRNPKDNYDSLIKLFPFDPNKDSSKMSADMDTIVRKISVGIQIHDPRVKWSNDLYLLLGEAYYYRGRYTNAATAFRYIIAQDEAAKKKAAAQNGYGNSNKTKEEPSIVEEEPKSKLDFLKHKSVHNDAILWLARTYTESKQVENGEAILSMLATDNKLPDDEKGQLAVEKAFAALANSNYPAASAQLTIASDDGYVPNWLRTRAAFLNGQLLQDMGEYTKSAASYEKALSFYPKIDMDFYCRRNIANARLAAGQNMDDAVRPLRKMLDDNKYATYYDQVYFVLGQLALKAKDNKQAITYFTKSTKTLKGTKKQKAVSFAALGDVYYSSSNYKAAKQAYDSAMKYSGSASKEKSIANALQREKGLDEIAIPAKVIYEQDSLMELAAMSKREQQAVVRRYLRDLEKKIQDSIDNAENAGVTAVAAAKTDPDDVNANWYFANPGLMQQGKTDFQKKWGNRPLKDNWRRMAAVGSGGDQGGDDLAAADDKGKVPGLPSEASLLAKIPNTQAQKDLSAKMEQRAYILLARGYMKQLEDYTMAGNTLDTLDRRWPNHNQKEEELYIRYQLAMKQNRLDDAKKYADELLSKYPESQYASSVRPRTNELKPDAKINGKTVPQYFDETYGLVMDHKYDDALANISVAKQECKNPAYKKRFEVTEAMAYAGNGNFSVADSVISKFLKSNAHDTLAVWASTVKQYIKEVRNGGKPSWYYDTAHIIPASMLVTKKTKKTDVTPAKQPTAQPVNVPDKYIYHADSEHLCILVLPGLDSRTLGLKKAVRGLDDTKYADAGLELLFDLYNVDQGVLVVRKFRNAADAKMYMKDLLASEVFHGFAPGEIRVFIIGSANYKKMLSDKNVTPYAAFYSANYN